MTTSSLSISVGDEAGVSALWEAPTNLRAAYVFAHGAGAGMAHKSMSAIASQAQALAPLPDVRGLVFFAFPLHPAGKPGDERAKHLADVKVPMLFLQGTKDALAELSLLEPAVAKLKPRATLSLFDDADHSFHVPAKTGRKDADVLAEILDAAAAWMIANAGRESPAAGR